MSFQKQRRIVNKALLAEIRALPCAACGKPGPSQACHIKTVKSGGGDTKDNVYPGCASCHHYQHNSGFWKLCLKYEKFEWWLKSHNWEFDLSGQWPKLIRVNST